MQGMKLLCTEPGDPQEPGNCVHKHAASQPLLVQAIQGMKLLCTGLGRQPQPKTARAGSASGGHAASHKVQQI